MPDDRVLVEAAAREAGRLARSYFGGHYKTWDKGKGQPVTEADLAVDRFLRETLTAARPSYGWLSEETEDNMARRGKERVFIVDPIDGTIAFLKGKPHFTICAAVVAADVSVAGVVFNPILDECFAAAEGCGATLNGEPIRVSSHNRVEGCRMLGARSMFEHPAWLNAPNTPWPPMEIETRNSVAYRIALVAGGSFDATMALSAKHDWDIAAADIILREAGGIVTTHDGAPLRYNGKNPIQHSFVCAGPALYALLLARLQHLKLPRSSQ